MPTSELILFLTAMAGIAALFWLIARYGGWRELARRYPGLRPHQQGKWEWWQRGRLRWWAITSICLRWFAGYNGCVLWRADDEYLHLRIMPPFNIFHPPISIPWRETEIVDEHVCDGKKTARWFVRLSVGGQPLILTRRVAAPLLERAAQGIP